MDRVPATQIPRSWLFRRHSINRLTSLQLFLELNPVCCLKYHQLLCIFILKGNPSCFPEPVEPVESSTSSPCHHFSQEAPAASRQAMMSANYECLGKLWKITPLGSQAGLVGCSTTFWTHSIACCGYSVLPWFLIDFLLPNQWYFDVFRGTIPSSWLVPQNWLLHKITCPDLDKVRTEDTAIYFSGWSGFYPPMTLVMRNLVFPDSFAKFAVVNLVKNHQPNNHQALLWLSLHKQIIFIGQASDFIVKVRCLARCVFYPYCCCLKPNMFADWTIWKPLKAPCCSLPSGKLRLTIENHLLLNG